MRKTRKKVECESADCTHNIEGRYCELPDPDLHPCYCLDYEERTTPKKRGEEK
ncbi:MAG: hypothetical protein QMD13_09430 [Candidatus Bathyarchaeia archaeon]|nr:hypothetical protein [Candidatus Bathyarchaeia archaeon]